MPSKYLVSGDGRLFPRDIILGLPRIPAGIKRRPTARRNIHGPQSVCPYIPLFLLPVPKPVRCVPLRRRVHQLFGLILVPYAGSGRLLC